MKSPALRLLLFVHALLAAACDGPGAKLVSADRPAPAATPSPAPAQPAPRSLADVDREVVLGYVSGQGQCSGSYEAFATLYRDRAGQLVVSPPTWTPRRYAAVRDALDAYRVVAESDDPSALEALGPMKLPHRSPELASEVCAIVGKLAVADMVSQVAAARPGAGPILYKHGRGYTLVDGAAASREFQPGSVDAALDAFAAALSR